MDQAKDKEKDKDRDRDSRHVAAAPASPPAKRRAYAGVSHAERVQQRSKALVKAAVQVFGSGGYHAATVKSLCTEAGLTDRYFYESFEDMEALLRAAYAQVAGGLLATLRRASQRAGDDTEAAIDACLAAYFRFVRKPQPARLLLMEVLGVSPAVDSLYQRTNVEFARTIVLPWLQQRGEASPAAGPQRKDAPATRSHGEDMVLAIALTGAVHSAATLWMLSGYRQPVSHMLASCRMVILGTRSRLRG